MMKVVHVKNVDFNSRTHVECDAPVMREWCDYVDFNSRTHVECDDCVGDCRIVSGYFNSRTHVECDAHASRSLQYD